MKQQIISHNLIKSNNCMKTAFLKVKMNLFAHLQMEKDPFTLTLFDLNQFKSIKYQIKSFYNT